MALEMKNADFARDKSGRKKLVANLQSDIDKAIKALTGSEYNNVRTTVSKYWVGTDADQFKANLQLSAKELAALFKEYKATIQKALDTDSKQFAGMQSQNAAIVGQSRKTIK